MGLLMYLLTYSAGKMQRFMWYLQYLCMQESARQSSYACCASLTFLCSCCYTHTTVSLGLLVKMDSELSQYTVAAKGPSPASFLLDGKTPLYHFAQLFSLGT